MAAKVLVGGLVRVRTKVPLWRQASRPVWFRGELLELDLVWASASKWGRSDISAGPGWLVLPVGPFVIAVRLRG